MSADSGWLRYPDLAFCAWNYWQFFTKNPYLVSPVSSAKNVYTVTLFRDCRREHRMYLVQSVRGIKRTRIFRTYWLGKTGELLTIGFVCRLLNWHDNEMGISLSRNILGETYPFYCRLFYLAPPPPSPASLQRQAVPIHREKKDRGKGNAILSIILKTIMVLKKLPVQIYPGTGTCTLYICVRMAGYY